jgi:hypothetical protein
MTYHPGDQIYYPTAIGRPLLCQIIGVDTVRVGENIAQIVKAKPIERPATARLRLVPVPGVRRISRGASGRTPGGRSGAAGKVRRLHFPEAGGPSLPETA